MPQTIAITGATGHIGINLVHKLLDRSFAVRALYHQPHKKEVLAGLDVELLPADVLDPGSLHQAFAGVDIVVHLAGIISLAGDPDGRVRATNITGTRNVVEACLTCGVRRLIHFSSIHAFHYTPGDPVVTEEHPLADNRHFYYDQSKAGGEREVLAGVARGLDAVILNPTAVIGPHDYWNSYAGQMLRDMMTGRLPALVPGGFDWVDARDLAEATVAAIRQGRTGERYILSGHWASPRQLAEWCARYTGRRPPRLELPLWVALLGLPFLSLYSRLTGSRPLYTYESIMVLKNANRYFSHAKATRELDYRPRMLETSIRDIYNWNRKMGYL